MSEIILKEENGQVFASSRDVAEKFGILFRLFRVCGVCCTLFLYG